MSKKKPMMMIPFTYYHENMITYCSASNRQMVWDTISNERITVWRYPEDTYEERLKEYNCKLDTGEYIQVPEVVWKENFKFEDTLYVDSMSRGRSAANFDLVSKTDGKSYNMFMTDMVDMIQNATIVNGVVGGKWTFCKRGQNYGIKLMEGEK